MHTKRRNSTNKIYEIIGMSLFSLFLISFIIFGSDKATNNIYRIIGICFCLFELFHILKEKKILINDSIKYLLFFLMYIFTTSILMFYSNSSIMLSIYVSLYIGISFMSFNFFSSIDDGREKLINILLFVGIFLSIYVLLYYGFSNYFQLLINGKRVGQEIANVNMIGLNTTLSSLIIYYKLVFKGEKKFLVFLIPLLIVSLGSGSKKVIIELIVGVLLITISKYKGKFNKNTIMKFFVTLLLLIISYRIISNIPIFNTIFSRFENMTNSILSSGKLDSENQIRSDFIKYGFEVFLKHPIFGIGFGNSSSVISSNFNYSSTYFHNNYIELLATTGLFGIMLYYLSYIKSLKYNLRVIKSNQCDDISKLCIILIIIQFITEYGMVSNQLPFVYIYIVLWNLNSKKCGEKNEE